MPLYVIQLFCMVQLRQSLLNLWTEWHLSTTCAWNTFRWKLVKEIVGAKVTTTMINKTLFVNFVRVIQLQLSSLLKEALPEKNSKNRQNRCARNSDYQCWLPMPIPILICPRYAKGIPKKSFLKYKYGQDMPKICPRYARDMRKICPRYAWDMPEICLRYAQDMPKICPRYARDMRKICPRCAQDMPKICLSHA